MAEFTPITTQAQLDAVLGERLKQEREATAKKYGDYDALKTRAVAAEKQLAELQRSMQADAEKYADYDKTLADLQAQLKRHQTDAAKTRIALEIGLPYAMASRLTGETEEDIRKDAQTLAQLMAGQQSRMAPPPLRSHEPVPSQGRAVVPAIGGDGLAPGSHLAMRAFAQQLTEQD